MEVRDTGKGMEGKDAQKVWEYEYKVLKDAVGLGLGLSSVRALAEREGGKVRCGQNEMEGSSKRGIASRNRTCHWKKKISRFYLRFAGHFFSSFFAYQ